MLPTDPKEARRQIEKTFPRDDPMSAFGVVWCAYDTLTQRTLTSNTRVDEEKIRRESGASAKCTYRSPILSPSVGGL